MHFENSISEKAELFSEIEVKGVKSMNVNRGSISHKLEERKVVSSHE